MYKLYWYVMTIFNDAKDIKKLSVNENNPHNPVSAKKKKVGENVE